MRRRGSVLAGVMALIAMLAVLVAALHWYRSINRIGLQRAEAMLEAQVALRWWEARWQGRIPADRASRAILKSEDNEELKTAANVLNGPFGQWVWQRDKLDLSATPARDLRAGQRLADLTVRNGTSSGRIRLTGTSFFPYAACAPRGSISADYVRSWANPRKVDESKPGAKGGGVSARLYGSTEVKVKSLQYGALETKNGLVRFDAGQGQLRTWVPAPQQDLITQLEGARERLTAINRDSGDKTDVVFTRVGPREFVEWVVGDFRRRMGYMPDKSWEQFRATYYTLNTATNYPFFTFPTGRIDPGGLFIWQFSLHPAQLPDIYGIGENPLEGAAAGPSPTPLPSPPPRNDDYRVPVSRLDEERFVNNGLLTDNGFKGLVYWGHLDNLGRLLGLLRVFADGIAAQRPAWEIIRDMTDQLATLTRVYHFGPPDCVPDFRIGEKERTVSLGNVSLTVPRGRSFYLDGTLSCSGDLWIQRGASFQVTGNLTLAPGRVVLEQGASLVVGKSLRVDGPVLVTSQDQRVEGITSALLVGGDVQLEQGVLPGITYEDLCAAVGREDADCARLADRFFSRYFEAFAPNQARYFGPFRTRRPWFADLATTARGIKLPPFIIILPLRFLANDSNFNCLFFQAATAVEVPFLNAVFGEFLSLHSNVWAFGYRQVPATLKLSAADSAVQARVKTWGTRWRAAELPLPDAYWRGDLYESQARQLMVDLDATPRNLLPELIGKVLWDALIFRLDFPGRPALLNFFIQNVKEAVRKAGNISTRFEAAFITRALKGMEAMTDDIQALTNGRELPTTEYPGALVYAGGTLRVGTTPLVTGMLVARGHVECGAERLVGSVFSAEGNIHCRSLWFYPGFTRASVTLPFHFTNKPSPYSMVVETDYGLRLFQQQYRHYPGRKPVGTPNALLIGGGQLRTISELEPGGD